MPIFDYHCEDCGKQSEIFISTSEYQPECSACGSRNLKKMISKPSSFSGASAIGCKKTIRNAIKDNVEKLPLTFPC